MTSLHSRKGAREPLGPCCECTNPSTGLPLHELITSKGPTFRPRHTGFGGGRTHSAHDPVPMRPSLGAAGSSGPGLPGSGLGVAQWFISGAWGLLLSSRDY